MKTRERRWCDENQREGDGVMKTIRMRAPLNCIIDPLYCEV